MSKDANVILEVKNLKKYFKEEETDIKKLTTLF